MVSTWRPSRLPRLGRCGTSLLSREWGLGPGAEEGRAHGLLPPHRVSYDDDVCAGRRVCLLQRVPARSPALPGPPPAPFPGGYGHGWSGVCRVSLCHPLSFLPSPSLPLPLFLPSSLTQGFGVSKLLPGAPAWGPEGVGSGVGLWRGLPDPWPFPPCSSRLICFRAGRSFSATFRK